MNDVQSAMNKDENCTRSKLKDKPFFASFDGWDLSPKEMRDACNKYGEEVAQNYCAPGVIREDG